ncbi:MAG: helix-turn-helix domain-containing protein [Anaerolineae bacterium]|nr:helix-turn-helix domain-containing protein [Anaerolineae bacterium]
MIGERLRDERNRLGLSQPALGEIAGAAKRTVIDWEKGASSPTAAQLAQLARAGVDPTYVLTGVRAVARAGLEQAEIDAFNQLIDDFFELDTSGRDSVLRMVSALAAAAATGGKARTVRKPSARREPEPTATAPLVAVRGKNI